MQKIDGPNIAYHGHPTVHYSTLKLVLDELESMGEVPLVVMPLKYTTPSFRTSGTHAQRLSDRELAMIERSVSFHRYEFTPRDRLSLILTYSSSSLYTKIQIAGRGEDVCRPKVLLR